MCQNQFIVEYQKRICDAQGPLVSDPKGELRQQVGILNMIQLAPL